MANGMRLQEGWMERGEDGDADGHVDTNMTEFYSSFLLLCLISELDMSSRWWEDQCWAVSGEWRFYWEGVCTSNDVTNRHIYLHLTSFSSV